MPDSWKTIPINAGLLVALVAGVAATILTIHSVQLWVDSRVEYALDRRLAPVEMQIDRMREQLEVIEAQRQNRDQHLLESLDELNSKLEDNQ